MSGSDSEIDVQEVLKELEGSDAQIARVTEDLVTLLIDKSIIRFTDLPAAVQSKLLHREQLRERLRQPVVSIISENDTL